MAAGAAWLETYDRQTGPLTPTQGLSEITLLLYQIVFMRLEISVNSYFQVSYILK